MTARSVLARSAGAGISAALLALMLVVLHRLGTGLLSAPPIGDAEAFQSWIAGRSPVTIGFALLRLVALGSAWYLVAVLSLGLLARLLRIPSLIIWADLATLPPVRRALTTVFGLSLTAAVGSIATIPMATGTAHRSPDQTGGVAVTMQRAEGTVVVMRAEAEGDDEHTATMRLVEPTAAVPTPVADPAAATWTVAPGDSVWSLASRHLEMAWQRQPSDREILSYWQQALDHNRTRLVDPQNPELIYAGQVLQAPPLPPLPKPSTSSTTARFRPRL